MVVQMQKFLAGLSFLLLSTINIHADVAVQTAPNIEMPSSPAKGKMPPPPAPPVQHSAESNAKNKATQEKIQQAASHYQIPSAEEAVSFVKGLVDKGIAVANQPGDHHQEFGELLRDNFITKEIAKFVLGSIWRSMDENEREQFHQIYQKRLVQIYSAPEKVNTFKSTIPNIFEKASPQMDGSVLVKSTFANKDGTGEPAKVDWKIVKKDGNCYVYDVLFEDISKLTNDRNEYRAIYSNQGKSNPKIFLAYLNSTINS